VCGCLCLCVCVGPVTTITRNCVHRSSPNWVGESSNHLQLIKFWPFRAPAVGICGGANIFGSALIQPARSVCASWALFHYVTAVTAWCLQRWLFAGWNAAADVARRAMLKYASPKKRGAMSTMLTVDNVSKLPMLTLRYLSWAVPAGGTLCNALRRLSLSVVSRACP